MRGLRWCLDFDSTATFTGVMSLKPYPDLCVSDVTSEVTG